MLREEYFSFILVQLNCFIISLISQKESLDDLSLSSVSASLTSDNLRKILAASF